MSVDVRCRDGYVGYGMRWVNAMGRCGGVMLFPRVHVRQKVNVRGRGRGGMEMFDYTFHSKEWRKKGTLSENQICRYAFNASPVFIVHMLSAKYGISIPLHASRNSWRVNSLTYLLYLFGGVFLNPYARTPRSCQISISADASSRACVCAGGGGGISSS
jgi:uncharacterized membrane protein